MNLSIFIMRPRTFLWLIQALIKRYNRTLLLGFSIGLIVFLSAIFAYPVLTPSLKKTDIKRIGVVGSYTPTDFPSEIQHQISFGLTNLTSTGEATLAAALNWEISEDGKNYTFHLDPKLLWQDGKQFTSNDVNYNLKGAQVKPDGPATLQIKLSEPFSPLPVLLSQPLFKPGLVGLGQYKVSLLKANNNNLTDLTLLPVTQSKSQPVLKFRFYPTQEKAILAFKLGEIDQIDGLNDLSAFVNWPVKVKSQVTRDYYLTLFYNTQDQVLSQKTVRQALTYALPDFSQGERARSPISPLSWAYNSKVKEYEYDPKMAKDLMSQTKEGTFSATTKITLTTTKDHEYLAKQISASWKKINLDVEIQIVEKIPENFQVLLAAQALPKDPDQYLLWHSTQEKTNISHYKSPRIDKLLEDGRKEMNQEARREKYLAFQKYLIDDVPAAFLYYPTVYEIIRPK